MSSNPRAFLVEPHTFASVRTTNQYQDRLAPTESGNNSVVYHAGFEAQRNGLKLHLIVTMPYQIGIIASTIDRNSNIPKFFQNCNSILAREFNTIHGVTGYFWRDRSYDYQPLYTTEDLVEAVANMTAKPVRDGLVDDPLDWLGLAIRCTTEDPLVVHATRPEFCGSRSKKPESIHVEFVHSDLLTREGVTPQEFQQRVAQRITLKVAEYLAARARFNPQAAPPLTIDEQMALEPLQYHGLIPQFITDSEEAYAEYCATSESHVIHQRRTQAFRRAYRHAFREWQQATDKNSVNFPIGTYKMRVIHNIQCTAAYSLE